MPSSREMTFDDPDYTYIQWVLAVPAACGGLAFAWFMTLGPTVYTLPAAWGWGGLALVVACSLQQALHGLALAPRALTGLGTMLASLMPWKNSVVPALARVGRRGYGIYLCHVIPVEILHLIFHRLHLHSSGWLDVTNFCLSFVAAWMLVDLLDGSARLAWLTGMTYVSRLAKET